MVERRLVVTNITRTSPVRTAAGTTTAGAAVLAFVPAEARSSAVSPAGGSVAVTWTVVVPVASSSSVTVSRAV